jgi:putative selenate reductase molybdopterin-binding subunit
MFNLKRETSKTIDPQAIILADSCAITPGGDRIPLAEIALETLHHSDQEQIMAVASYYSPVAPPPFAAQFAEVILDIETGQVTVQK